MRTGPGSDFLSPCSKRFLSELCLVSSHCVSGTAMFLGFRLLICRYGEITDVSGDGELSFHSLEVPLAQPTWFADSGHPLQSLARSSTDPVHLIGKVNPEALQVRHRRALVHVMAV